MLKRLAVLMLSGRWLPLPLVSRLRREAVSFAPLALVDIWWDVGKDTPFESYGIDVDISDDVPSSVNLYISPIGLGHLSKTPFYGGNPDAG